MYRHFDPPLVRGELPVPHHGRPGPIYDRHFVGPLKPLHRPAVKGLNDPAYVACGEVIHGPRGQPMRFEAYKAKGETLTQKRFSGNSDRDIGDWMRPDPRQSVTGRAHARCGRQTLPPLAPKATTRFLLADFEPTDIDADRKLAVRHDILI